MEIIVVDVYNTVVNVESTGVLIETPGLQYTLHEGKNNEGEDGETIEIEDK